MEEFLKEKQKDDWDIVKNYFPLPTIDPLKFREEINFQVKNYFTLKPLKSYRCRLAITFALMINLVFVLYLKDRGLDSFAVFTLFLNAMLVLVWKGKKLAMYPLMPIAFIYPIIFSASIFPSSGQLMNLGLFLAIAAGLRLMIEIYKAVQVENLRMRELQRQS